MESLSFLYFKGLKIVKVKSLNYAQLNAIDQGETKPPKTSLECLEGTLSKSSCGEFLVSLCLAKCYTAGRK